MVALKQIVRYLLAAGILKSIFTPMETKDCPHCGRPVEPSVKFCSECGAAMDKQKTEATATSKPAGSPLKEIILVVGVVAAITLGYFVFSTQPPVPQPSQQAFSGHEGMEEMGAGMPNLPEDYEGLVAAGDQYMNQNNFPIAAECYKRALVIDGNSPDVRSDFGSCLYGMGLADRALEEFRTVKNNFPLHSVSLFNMGVVFYGQTKSDSAKYYLSKYLELEPGGKAAEQATTYLKELGI